jgi:cell division protein FtsB
MTKKRHQSIISLSLPRIVTIVTLTLVAILVIEFGRKALDSYHVQRQVDRLRQQVAAEEEKNAELQERLAYVSSDASVEEMAREVLKMVKPGDAAVVVIPNTVEENLEETSPMPTTEGPEEEPEPYWRQWWDLIFGSNSSDS